MKSVSVILMALCLGLFGCSSDSGSGSSEPPDFSPSGTWNTRNEIQPQLIVTLVLDQESPGSPNISGTWGSQGDSCFASGTTNGFSGTMSASQIILYLTNESGGQMRQIRATLDGIIGTTPPASLSGMYVVTQHDTNPECIGTQQSVLLDCDVNTACGTLL